jgi:hypothetical protein
LPLHLEAGTEEGDLAWGALTPRKPEELGLDWALGGTQPLDALTKTVSGAGTG